MKPDKDYYLCIKVKEDFAYITDKRPRKSKNVIIFTFRKGKNVTETKKELHKLAPLVCYTTVKKMVGANAADALECNFYQKNPYCSSGPMMRLYFLCRAERLKELDPEIEKRKAERKAAANKAVSSKYRKAFAYADGVEINVVEKDGDEVLAECYDDREMWYWLSEKVFSGKITKRMFVNFVRHRLSDYDEKYTAMRGLVGMKVSHDILQDRYNDKIREMYATTLATLPD